MSAGQRAKRATAAGSVERARGFVTGVAGRPAVSSGLCGRGAAASLGLGDGQRAATGTYVSGWERCARRAGPDTLARQSLRHRYGAHVP